MFDQGPPGPGGGGPNDLIRETARAVNLLVSMKQKEEERLLRREQTDTDVRLKIEKKLCKIAARSAEKFPEEIEEFEVQMRKNKIKTWANWYYYFEEALEPRAKAWVNGTHTRDPGKAWYEYAQNPDAPDWAWMEVYRLARTELARKVGLAYETPGDTAQAAWDAITFSKNPNFVEIEKTLERVDSVRTRMYKCERFDYSPKSVEKEMSDLKRMVPLGSELRKTIYGKDYQPTSYDAWLNIIQQYQSTLERPKEEKGGQAADTAAFTQDGSVTADGGQAGVAYDGYDSWADQGQDPWEQDDPWQDGIEAAGRLNDSRMAGGGRYQQARPKGGSGGKGAPASNWHPVCARCTGRHPSAMECPNLTAIRAGFDANKVTNTVCTFMYNDLKMECRGKGHLQNHHAKAHSEYLAKSGSFGPTPAHRALQTHQPPRGATPNARGQPRPPQSGKGKGGSGRTASAKGTGKKGKGKGKRKMGARRADDSEWAGVADDGTVDSKQETEYDAQWEGYDEEDWEEEPEADAEAEEDDIVQEPALRMSESLNRPARTVLFNVPRTSNNSGFDMDALLPMTWGREAARMGLELEDDRTRHAPETHALDSLVPLRDQFARGPDKRSLKAKSGGAERRSFSVPARVCMGPPRKEASREGVSTFQHPEPLLTIPVGQGYHCVVSVYINEKRFRITLDTGCARNFIRSSFRDQLAKNSATSGAVLRRSQGDRPILCTGISKGMETAPVTKHTTIRMSFLDVPDSGIKTKGKTPVDAVFGELDDSCDALLVGFPTLMEWGFYCRMDEDGQPWVGFARWDITLPAEKPTDL